MDLVDYDQAVYDGIVKDYAEFANGIGIKAFTPIPISGFRGDNITGLSANTPWYTGPALMEHLETVEVDQDSDREKTFRMAVPRSEERRVGKECVSQCRYRWWPYPLDKRKRGS